jgi:hypothetical protein
MSLKVVDGGLTKILDKLMTAYGSTLTIKLFKSNTTPAAGDTAGTYTEADFPGYASQTITTWGAATIASSVATSTAEQKTFTRSSTGTVQNIYGYFVLDSGGNLLWAERDPSAPIALTNSGDAYLVTPKFTEESKY